MRELEKGLTKLRQQEFARAQKLKSLEILEDIAHWQMMQHFKKIIDEVQKHKLRKAGFKIEE